LTKGTGRRQTPAARAADPGDPRRARHARLVAAVREDDDHDALEALVAEHLGLVRRIARRFGVDADQRDDLFQEGVVGLLKAIRRFDPGRGVPFPAYAATAVTGEIRHHLRDRASCVRVPEAVQELRVRLDRLAVEARAETGREPELRALAERAGVSHEAAAEASSADVVPLEHDVPTTASGFRRSEDRVELEGRLSCLRPREREVVYLRFFADLTQDEIARSLGISQMHVSRLLRRALQTMRDAVP
jgi:RNA polymerase sigma-B factor